MKRTAPPSSFAFKLLAFAVAFSFVCPIMPTAAMAAGAASGPSQGAAMGVASAGATPVTSAKPSDVPIGTPSLLSSYLVGNGSALIFVGANSWTAQWQSESNGSQLYTSDLTLLAFDLRSWNVTVKVDTYEANHGWVSNQSILLSPGQETVITVPFPQDVNWRSAHVWMDGRYFLCQVATPISLLPPSILNIGGEDILGLAIISEGLACYAGMLGLARILMKRARWARKFSLLVWGHVVVIGLAALVVVNYQWVDQTFAGWSPLVYAFAVSPMMLVSSLSIFNKSQKAELLQRVARPNGRILYRRWLLRYSVLDDGRVVLINERWGPGGFLARLFGHYAVVEKEDEFTPVPFEGVIEHRRSPTDSKGVRRVSDRFRVTNAQEDEVETLWFTDSGDPVVVKWTRLSVHKMRPARTKLSREGQVLETIPEKRVLTWPHFEEAVVELKRALEDYAASEAISGGWANVRDLTRVLSKVKTDLYATKANFTRQVNAEVESRLLAYYSLVGQPDADLTDEEAKDMAQRGEPRMTLSELLDEARLRGSRPSNPTESAADAAHSGSKGKGGGGKP